MLIKAGRRIRMPDGVMVTYKNLTLVLQVQILLRHQLVVVAYLVKHLAVNQENRVRTPQCTHIENRKQTKTGALAEWLYASE